MNYEDDFGRRLTENAVEAIKLAQEYQAMRKNAPPSAETAEEFDPELRPVVIYDVPAPPETNLENLTEEKTKQKEDENMPPKIMYADGSFRQKGKRKEYRFMHEGRQLSVMGDTKQECFDKRTAILQGKIKLRPKKLETVSDWFEGEYYEMYIEPNYKEKGQRQMWLYIRNFCKDFGKMPLKQITTLDIMRFLLKYEDKKNAQAKVMVVLKAGFRIAHEMGKIRLNPYNSAIKIKRHQPDHHEALQFKQQTEFFNATKESPEFHRLFRFMCCTGQRVGETLKIKVSDVDFENHRIRIYKPERNNKGFTHYVDFLPELFDGFDLSCEGLLFEGVTYDVAQDFFDKIFDKLGIDDSIHCFRNTFISTCHFLRYSDKQIAEYAGHTTTKMTIDLYTKLLNNGTSEIKDYLEKMKREYGL